jgi:hypothetical protein
MPYRTFSIEPEAHSEPNARRTPPSTNIRMANVVLTSFPKKYLAEDPT